MQEYKKLLFIAILSITISCQSQNLKMNDNVLFVLDFLEKIHSKQKFTLQDEQMFLGINGGLLGLILNDQLSSNEMQAVLTSKRQIPLIGTLLQLKKEFFMNKSTVIYIGEMNDMLIQSKSTLALQKLHGLIYVVVIGFSKKDIMTLDNKANVCIFAIYKKNGKTRIDLPHTIIDGMRAPAVLGFIDANNKYDMKLNSNDFKILLNNLSQN